MAIEETGTDQRTKNYWKQKRRFLVMKMTVEVNYSPMGLICDMVWLWLP